MKILVVEDVTLVAERISDLAKVYLENPKVRISHTLEDALIGIREEVYDLVFLDLNLNGKDGFDLLKETVQTSFYTIIITANRDRASKAFDIGVLDFISKPISEKRFEMAIARYLDSASARRESLKCLAIKSRGKVHLIKIDEIKFIKASGNYSEIYTFDGKVFVHDKNLDKLITLLADNFVRVHRSYIVPQKTISKIVKRGGGRYDIVLMDTTILPLSRTMYRALLEKMDVGRE